MEGPGNQRFFQCLGLMVLWGRLAHQKKSCPTEVLLSCRIRKEIFPAPLLQRVYLLGFRTGQTVEGAGLCRSVRGLRVYIGVWGLGVGISNGVGEWG